MNLYVLDKILAIDVVNYVGIIDSKGNLIYSKGKKDKTSNEELHRVELVLIKKMLDIYDNSLGKMISMQTIREKTHQMIFYHDYMIIYVACESSVEPKKMSDVSIKINNFIKELISTNGRRRQILS